MFPHHNNSDPFFVQFSRDSNPLQHTYPYSLDFAGDNTLVDFAAGFPLPHDEINTGSSLYRAAEINEDDLDGDRKKKHREIERLRRKEMAALYSNLRSVVPPEYMKRKRSVSDLMNEAKNYIKDLEEKVKELSVTRDELKKSLTRNITSGSLSSSSNSVEVGPWSDSVEIIISIHVAPEECVHLSAIIKALVHEGLNVITVTTNLEMSCELASSS